MQRLEAELVTIRSQHVNTLLSVLVPLTSKQPEVLNSLSDPSSADIIHILSRYYPPEPQGFDMLLNTVRNVALRMSISATELWETVVSRAGYHYR